MEKKKYTQMAVDILVDIIGGILIGIGVYNFAASSQFPMVGLNGIGLIFYHLFGMPIGTTVLLLNIPIALCCYRILGKRFFMRSVRTIIITSVIMDYVVTLFPVYTGDKLLSAICCGVLSGLGYAMIYLRETSTGGADFITLSIKAKYPHLTIGNIAFVMDAFVVLLGTILVSKDIDNLIYGVIVSYLLSTVVDKVMYGIDEGKVALIVTEHGTEICAKIDEVLERGSTILKGIGSYSKEEKDVVMCACNNKEMVIVRRLIKQVDKKAFLVIMESNEVVGEGFKEE